MVQEKQIYYDKVDYHQRYNFDTFMNNLPGSKLAMHKSYDPSCKGQYEKAWHVRGVTLVCKYTYQDWGSEGIHRAEITAIGAPKPISKLEEVIIKNARKILTKPLNLKSANNSRQNGPVRMGDRR